MACKGCSTGGNSGGSCATNGCSGGCATGGCNRLNTYDWLANSGVRDVDEFRYVEVSFKNGAKKEFYLVDEDLYINTGEMVVVDTGSGYDVGKVTLNGELVRLQMRKKRVKPESIILKAVRKANERDLERLDEARQLDKSVLIRARAIAHTLGLDMKVGDVEHQGDLRKATFYFTADGRVDFRELIRLYAKEFKVKIEMRQIGSRQESARIGGIGSCGRELCCSTWLTDFKSVATTAARYQNLAINQAKLSGQCGRLKCCLNYELDTYVDALKKFPSDNIVLKFEQGNAYHVKTDIFKGLMYYSTEAEKGRTIIIAMEKDAVNSIIEMNKKGVKPADPRELEYKFVNQDAEEDMGYADVTGEIELPDTKRKKKKKKRPNQNRERATTTPPPAREAKNETSKTDQPKAPSNNTANKPPSNRNKNKRRPPRGPKPDQKS